MSTDVVALMGKLKALRGKLPPKGPAGFEQDYSGFVKKADFYLTELKQFSDDGPTPKDLTEFPAKKQELAKLKDKINAAIKEQEKDRKSIDLTLREIMGMYDQLQKKLDGKKDAAALSKAIQNFTAAAAQAGVPDPPSSVFTD
jgi:DNA repair exonuclease SbcCD ATPase subunit